MDNAELLVKLATENTRLRMALDYLRDIKRDMERRDHDCLINSDELEMAFKIAGDKEIDVICFDNDKKTVAYHG
jgi:hypothetical protein